MFHNRQCFEWDTILQMGIYFVCSAHVITCCRVALICRACHKLSSRPRTASFLQSTTSSKSTVAIVVRMLTSTVMSHHIPSDDIQSSSGQIGHQTEFISDTTRTSSQAPPQSKCILPLLRCTRLTNNRCTTPVSHWTPSSTRTNRSSP